MNRQFSTQEIEFGFYLTNEVFNGHVFGERLDMSRIAPERLSHLFHEVYRLSAKALQPLAKFNPQLVEHILGKTIFKSVAFISALAYELLIETDVMPPLDKAGAAMTLVQITDHLMDRGDAKMVKALELYFAEETSNDSEVQARMDILAAIMQLSYQTSLDEGELIADATLGILRDELQVYHMSKCYTGIKDQAVRHDFLNEMANEIAALSIHNVGLRPGTYMVYSCYRRFCPELPSVQQIMAQAALEPLSYFGEWAIRLWDDFGDQEIDASESIYTNSYIINPFVLRHESLSRAYLQEIDSDADYDNFMDAMLGNEARIKKLVAQFVSEISQRLPERIEANYGTYLCILRRIIEAGYVNSRGDEEITYTTDVISDYS
jgi:hypothetical protein